MTVSSCNWNLYSRSQEPTRAKTTPGVRSSRQGLQLIVAPKRLKTERVVFVLVVLGLIILVPPLAAARHDRHSLTSPSVFFALFISCRRPVDTSGYKCPRSCCLREHSLRPPPRSYIELCDSNNTVPRSPVSVSKPKAYRAAASVAGKPRSCRSVAHTLTICDNPDTATVVPIVVRLILVYRASLTYALHRSPQLM